MIDTRRTSGIAAMVNLADALNASGQIDRSHELAQWTASFYTKLVDNGTESSWWANLYLSCSLAILGDDASALEALERLTHNTGMAWYPVVRDQPCFQKFADEPRYRAVVSYLDNQKLVLRERLPDTLARFQTLQ